MTIQRTSPKAKKTSWLPWVLLPFLHIPQILLSPSSLSKMTKGAFVLLRLITNWRMETRVTLRLRPVHSLWIRARSSWVPIEATIRINPYLSNDLLLFVAFSEPKRSRLYEFVYVWYITLSFRARSSGKVDCRWTQQF